MSAVCRIVADAREPPDGVPRGLAERGVEVSRRRLRSGDYALPNGVLVERKTVLDLHAAVTSGRFWRQVGSLRDASRAPYLLIEGTSLDDGPLSSRAVRGICLGAIGQGVPILWSTGAADSAEWLVLLASRAAGLKPARDRPTYAQITKPAGERVPEAVLAAVPGISTKRASALLAEFGNVANVIGAGPDAWLAVRGIGPAQAARLSDAFF